MPTPTVDVFVANLRRSTLLSPDRWRHVESWLERPERSADPRQLATELIDRGWLTAWQTAMLLASHDAFFLGRYKLLDQLGAGGMGTVFKAEQMPLGRIVALKVMSPELLKNPSAVARFHREIQAAAALSHPHVVAAFDAESVGDTHFLVVEYIAGKDLNHYAAGNRAFPVGWACECIRQAALGLQHAHERGLVHRDIKPANLLVTVPSEGSAAAGAAQPVVKILDMGLSRFVSESVEDGGLTSVGQVMGTPDYISPEQARDTHTADIRSDIFSLGCTLFRLLTGRVPFDGNTVVQKLLARTTRDAPRLASFRPDAPPGLDVIVAQMLARDPDRRYQTPQEVSRALAPFCNDLGALPQAEVAAGVTAELVPAISRLEVEVTSVFESTNPTLNKFLNALAHCAAEHPSAANPPLDTAGAARRETLDLTRRGSPTASTPRGVLSNRSLRRTAISTAIACLAIIAVGWGTWLAFARGTIVVEWPLGERDGGQLKIDEKPVPLPAGGAVRIALRPGKYAVNLARPGYEPLAVVAEVKRGADTSLQIDWQPIAGTRRRQEWQALERELPPVQAAGDEFKSPVESSPAESTAAKLQTFRRRWPGTDEGLNAARELARLKWPLDKLAAADIPERERFAWHPPELVAVFGETGPAHAEVVHAVVYRPDGAQVASSGGDGLIRLWDPVTMRQQAEVPRQTRVLAYTADSRILIAGGPGAVFFDMTGPAPIEKFSLSDFDGPVGKVVISPDGRTLVLIDSKVRLFDFTASPPQEYAAFATDSWEAGAAFTPDSHTLITYSAEKTIKLWNLPIGRPPELRARLEAHGVQGPGDYICGIVVSADGNRMVSSGVWDFSLWSWDLQPAVPRDPLGFHHSIAPSVITRASDGKMFAVGDWNGAVSLFDFTTNIVSPMISLKGHAAQVWGAAFSPDGKQLVSGGSEGALRVWTIDGADSHERELPHVGHRRQVSGVSFSSDGRRLFSTGYDGRSIVWDVASRQPLRELRRITGPILASGLSPDGQLLAVGDQEQAALHLIDSTTGEIRFTLHGMPWPATFRFSPDGRRIAAPVGNTIRSWSLADERELPTVGVYGRPVAAFAYFSNGKSLVAGNNTAPYAPPATGDVKQWGISTDKELLRLPAGNASIGVTALDCSPDGKTIAVALQPSGMIVWNITGQTPRPTTVEGPAISAVAFSPDGRHLLTLASGNSVVTLRHPETGAELKTWRLACQPQSLTVSPDSRHLALGNANGTICILRID